MCVYIILRKTFNKDILVYFQSFILYLDLRVLHLIIIEYQGFPNVLFMRIESVANPTGFLRFFGEFQDV